MTKITTDNLTPLTVNQELTATLDKIRASDLSPKDKLIAMDEAQGDARELLLLIKERARQRGVREAQPPRRSQSPTVWSRML